MGLEPTRPFGQQSLSLPCLPIPAPPRGANYSGGDIEEALGQLRQPTPSMAIVRRPEVPRQVIVTVCARLVRVREKTTTR